MNLLNMKRGDSGKPVSPCACFNVRRMSRAITQIYDDALRPTGLRSTQFSLLIGIGIAGSDGIGAIAEGLDTDRTTLSRNLKPLIAQGLVKEFPTEDGRVRALALTELGGTTLESALPLWETAQERIQKGLSRVHYEALPAIADEIVALAQGK